MASTMSNTTPTTLFEPQRYDFTRQRLFPGFDGKFCKIQPKIRRLRRGTLKENRP